LQASRRAFLAFVQLRGGQDCRQDDAGGRHLDAHGAVAGQLVEDRAQLSRPVDAFFAAEAALDDLHLGTMRHGHGSTLLTV
jgi:hypothetical protein